MTECECPPLAVLMRLSLEGKANPCPAHGHPATPEPSFALNDGAAISAAIRAALDRTEGDSL